MTGQIFMSSVADVDFMIHGLFSYELFGHTVWITTSHVCILIVMLTLILFALIANRRIKSATEVPDGFQNVLEMMVEFFDIATIFIFIWVSNISGLFGLRPPTADYGTTLALALITFVMIHYNEVKYNSPKDLWISKTSPLPPWLPLWLPINIISDIAVPISLSLRLFANVLSGTIIMALMYGMVNRFAYVWPAALHVYFDLFSGTIQTYVFTMLTMTFVSGAIGDSEE